MIELLGAFVALTAALVVSYFTGKKKKREFLAKVQEKPQEVARIYLRHAAEVDSYWLHAELKSGKKARIAAPWEIDATLARLLSVGLQLSDNDKAALTARTARNEAEAKDPARAARGAGGQMTVTA